MTALSALATLATLTQAHSVNSFQAIDRVYLAEMPLAIDATNSPWFHQGVTQLLYAGIIVWIIVLLQQSGK